MAQLTMTGVTGVQAGSPDRVAVPGSIDRSGRQDVSRPLQAFVDRVPNGTTIVFPAAATYRLDGSGIQVRGRRDLVFEGNGATLQGRGCGTAASLFQVHGGSDIVIRDFRLVGDNEEAGSPDGYHADCQHQHGVALYGATRVRIRDVRVRRVHGDCVYVGLGSGWTRGVVFRDSVCRLTGRQGFTVVAGADIRVEAVHFDDIAINAFDIEPNDGSGGATNVTFIENSVGRYGRSGRFRGFLLGANGSHDALVAGIRVIRTRVSTTLDSLVGDEWTGYDGQRNRRDFVFRGNRAETRAPWGPLLTFKHVDGVVVRDNVQPIADGGLARFIDSTGVEYTR